MRRFTLAVLALFVVFAPAQAAGIKGKYVEARTCDVWTGPCFANADFNLTGKNAVMAWKIDKGEFNNVSLDGLGVVAVISAPNTLGLQQSGPARSVLIVDSRANAAQREALVRFAQKQAGKLLDNILTVQLAPVTLTICPCAKDGCTELSAGGAKIKTRCIDADHDKACGNETAFYPPLAQGVTVRPAAAVEHVFRGQGLRETWGDFDRRGAYVGSFDVK